MDIAVNAAGGIYTGGAGGEAWSGRDKVARDIYGAQRSIHGSVIFAAAGRL